MSSCRLDHCDLLIMDGQCQDEFLNCTNPGLEQERINGTSRWIRQHATSCPFLRTGVVCCLPTCAQGSSAAFTRVVGYGAFWAFWVLLGVLCIWGYKHCQSTPSCVQDSGYEGVHFAGPAVWAEVGGSINFVTFGSSLVCTKMRLTCFEERK